jgi:hypothetical protein
MHIGGRSKPEPHRLPSFARVVDGKLIYDGGVQLELG